MGSKPYNSSGKHSFLLVKMYLLMTGLTIVFFQVKRLFLPNSKNGTKGNFACFVFDATILAEI